MVIFSIHESCLLKSNLDAIKCIITSGYLGSFIKVANNRKRRKREGTWGSDPPFTIGFFYAYTTDYIKLYFI